MGRLGFEPRTSRLKAECSTTELASLIAFGNVFQYSTAQLLKWDNILQIRMDRVFKR